MESLDPTYSESLPEPIHTGWAGDFVELLKTRMHGPNLQELAEPKPHVAEMARDFAGNHLPDPALEVAEVAHLAELIHHFNMGANIHRCLADTLGTSIEGTSLPEWMNDEKHIHTRYTLGLLRDFPVIADFTKAHEKKCQDIGHEYVDIQGLVGLVEQTNFESIIIKSALDYSNFLYLNEKATLTPQESAKIKRVVTAIKTVDAPLLALTGFDALEAEILSKAYSWELETAGNSYFVSEAEKAFDEYGGRQELASATEQLLEQLFINDSFVHDRVTSDQHDYGVFFSDGSLTFKDAVEGEEFRVLSRLKSVGATAKKMHALYNKTERFEIPMDIIGVTFIAKDKNQMGECLQQLFDRLSNADVTFQSAPSRYEEVHVKGRPDFLQLFGREGEYSALYKKQGLEVQDEPCINGYEAVKLTMVYQHEGMDIPMEIQVTHETARTESRIGLGSHTLFKLMKLAKDAGTISISELSDDEILDRLRRIGARKQKLDKTSYETNGESRERAKWLFQELRRRTQGKLAHLALHR